MWTEDELRQIAAADDLHIAPYRADGETTGTLTWIWSVVVDGGLCVHRPERELLPRDRRCSHLTGAASSDSFRCLRIIW